LGVRQCSHEHRGVIRSVVGASYSRTLLIANVVSLLHNKMVCLQKNRNQQLNT